MECKCFLEACEEHPPVELLSYMDEAIMKAKEIMDGGSPDPSFTSEETYTYYSSVYSLLTNWSEDQNNTHALQLWQKFEGALKDSINSEVLPSLANESHVPFLKKLLQHWLNYKKMTECLSYFFDSLEEKSGTSLLKISVNLFSTLVCDALWMKIRDAVIRMTNGERQGQLIDWVLLKGVISELFMFIDNNSGRNYYNELEQVILIDIVSRYNRLALNWLSHDKFSKYVQKVEWRLKEEKNAGYYLPETTMVKLLEDLRRLLVDESPVQYIFQLVYREVKDDTGSNK